MSEFSPGDLVRRGLDFFRKQDKSKISSPKELTDIEKVAILGEWIKRDLS